MAKDDKESKSTLERLRALHRAATLESNRLELVKVTAARDVEAQNAKTLAAARAYDEAIMQARMDANCAAGWSIDVHGDGAVKPIAECHEPGGRPPAPPPAPMPRAPNGK